MKTKFIAVALGTLVLASVPAAAQTASATVTAEVQRPLTVTKTTDLDFQEVFPGVNKVVAVADATAGSFHIYGQDNAQVQMTFLLPTTLQSGANMLPIDTWTAIHNTTNSAAAGTTFTPSSTATTVSLSGTGNLYVFIGATVKPIATQVAGTYTGNATLTVVYF